MDEEHKQEIIDEELQEIKEEPMQVWIEYHKKTLEENFLYSVPAEDQPLDDDIPDFLDKHADEFDLFCKQSYGDSEC